MNKRERQPAPAMIGLHKASRTSPGWLRTMLRYVVLVTLLNVVWECLQLPLYTIWYVGKARDIVISVLHCTAGDALIATFSLILALVLAGTKEWPNSRFKAVAFIAILNGIGYTVYSEWHNTTVTLNWAYSTSMPRLFGIGLSPVAQWLVIPSFVFWWIHRRCLRMYESFARPERPQNLID